MNNLLASRLLALLLSFPALLTAQAVVPAEPARPETGAAQARALLAKALERMASLSSYRFASEVDLGPGDQEGNIGLMISSALGPPPVGRRMEGCCFRSGLVSFTLDGADQGLLHRGLAMYRSGSRWRPRLATGPAGEPLWWVPDPARLLAELAAGEAEVTIDRNEILAQRPVRVLKLALEGDRAADLLLAGMAPDPSKVPTARRGRATITRSFFGGRGLPKDLHYTFELWVDASTGLIHRLAIQGTCANQEGMGAGAMVIRMGGQGQPQEETPKEEPKSQEVKLHLGFSDHGEAPLPEVPAQVLLRLGLEQEKPSVQRDV